MDFSLRTEALRLHDEVVLMSGLFGRASLFPQPTDPRRKETDGITHGLSSDAGKDPSRTAKILDALAQVGVQNKEVIAVAVAPSTTSNRDTVLYVASNEAVPSATQEYYRTLLQLIKKLALSHIPHETVVDPCTISPAKNEEKESSEVKGSCLSLCTLESR